MYRWFLLPCAGNKGSPVQAVVWWPRGRRGGGGSPAVGCVGPGGGLRGSLGWAGGGIEYQCAALQSTVGAPHSCPQGTHSCLPKGLTRIPTMDAPSPPHPTNTPRVAPARRPSCASTRPTLTRGRHPPTRGRAPPGLPLAAAGRGPAPPRDVRAVRRRRRRAGRSRRCSARGPGPPQRRR